MPRLSQIKARIAELQKEAPDFIHNGVLKPRRANKIKW